MKYYFITIGISLFLFISTQTHSVFGINGNDVNATESSINTSNKLETESLDKAENVTSYSKFLDMISEGKTTFLNINNIKPNTIIKPNTVTCFSGDDGGHNYPTTSKNIPIFIQELACDNLIVFEKNETYGKNSIRSQGSVIASKLLTVLDEGIKKPISACVVISPSTSTSGGPNVFAIPGGGTGVNLEGINCEELFIAYK